VLHAFQKRTQKIAKRDLGKILDRIETVNKPKAA
jgi:phage-related protein